MAPIHWILFVWSIGTCIATLFMINHIEEDSTYKKIKEKYSSIYTEKFMLFLFYVGSFVHSFFLWWVTVPKMIVAWVQVQLITLAVKKMIKLADTDDPKRTEKLARLMKVIKTIASSDGKKEEDKDEEDVV